MEPPSLVLPLVYDMTTNLTQLAEKRDAGPVPAMTAANQMLKHFAQYQHSECSLYPAVRELLMNLVLPSEPQQPSPAAAAAAAAAGGVQQIQSPAMQMPQGGQAGYPVNMPMGMMGP